MNTPLLFESGLQILFYVAMLSFVIYSCFLIFHWFNYGSNRALSMLSLAIYLLGSAVLFIGMSVALISI